MKKFCIISNTSKDTDGRVAGEVCERLEREGFLCEDITMYGSIYQEDGYIDKEKLKDDFDCAIVLGGDGTIIRSAKELAPLDIPILGINLGTLGYLAEVEYNRIKEAITCIRKEDYRIEERMMLMGGIYSGGEYIGCDIALNDVVVSRNGYSRIISTNIYVNDEMVAKYMGDGIIVSTPTGSTGYNLSAGGPIVKPNTSVMIITPICSHGISNRSIVVSDKDEVVIEILESRKVKEEEVIVTFDGRSGTKLGQHDRIVIQRAKEKTKLMVVGDRKYFDVLSAKFGNVGVRR
ncbi:MAG: NAD(+)/NADH kinase [Lachnospiraceae bacterium]|nr:NAD(+)/NADH kinase [Lachnospiraceae bacterium]